MLSLRKTRRAIAMTVASLGLMTGLGVANAQTASASSYVCYVLTSGADASQCSHHYTFTTGQEFYNTSQFNSAFTYLKIQGDGNFVLYCKNSGWSFGLQRNVSAGQAVWASGWTNSGTLYNKFKVDFWSDGNMATYAAYNSGAWQVTWNTQTWHGSDSIAVVQTDGNFVVWEGGQAYWASNTYHYCPGSENYWNGYA